MIKSDRQLAITKRNRDNFLEAIELLKSNEDKNLLNQIMFDSLTSQIETLNKEIKEYEELKKIKSRILFSEIKNLPEILVKARIIKGISQEDLAKKIGLKAQQIQRYESNNYEGANFNRILEVSRTLDITFDKTKITLNTETIPLSEYTDKFIIEATKKLRNKKALLTVIQS
ncbi:helix-turn-helix domain-containing protein [Algoriphagus aestuariicola]|uniref:Helix-turn-helix domain-containing protein n=1 Tax=Algoriphagus aestuariicola TaxID=1852016 RepID=A0ABS3BZC7_9BACT|nr:helix-turn-helix transcriptional regulator [Algoriphagus aestuariicola]MBN7803084.1 helix-turn-helix domain-containing protein [Algoriphagus aestuariicola]